jgi:Na+-driven multidrug efflux pump
LIKVLALIHLFDGAQAFNGGILRAVGAQFYASIAMFIGFCVIGTPIGTTLLLKTELKAYGKI